MDTAVEVQHGEIVQPDYSSLSLDELATEANGLNSGFEHQLGELREIFKNSARLAISAGRVLLAAQERVPRRDWRKWCEDNLNFHYSAACRYVRVARYESEVLEWIDAGGSGTLGAVSDMLVGRPPSRPKGVAPAEHDVKTARELRRSGATYTEIAEVLGAHKSTVRRWADPAALRESKAAVRRSKAKRVAAQKALEEKERREERAALAKKATPETSRAYADVRKLCLTLDAALAGATAGRDDLRRALALVHKAEDALVAAMQSERVENQ